MGAARQEQNVGSSGSNQHIALLEPCFCPSGSGGGGEISAGELLQKLLIRCVQLLIHLVIYRIGKRAGQMRKRNQRIAGTSASGQRQHQRCGNRQAGGEKNGEFLHENDVSFRLSDPAAGISGWRCGN